MFLFRKVLSNERKMNLTKLYVKYMLQIKMGEEITVSHYIH